MKIKEPTGNVCTRSKTNDRQRHRAQYNLTDKDPNCQYIVEAFRGEYEIAVSSMAFRSATAVDHHAKRGDRQAKSADRDHQARSECAVKITLGWPTHRNGNRVASHRNG